MQYENSSHTQKVSAIIPLYNHSGYIEDAVISLLEQTRYVNEIIVVDDGSTDSSPRVMEALCKKHAQIVFWSQPNQGAHHAINSGIHRATGDIIAILNSDDSYHLQRIELCIEALTDTPDAQALVTGIDFIDNSGNFIVNPWYKQAYDFFKQTGDLGLSLINGNFIMTTSNFVIRRKTFSNIGYFSDLRYAHDLDFLLRMYINNIKIVIIDKPLLNYRIHSSNTISENHERVRIEWAAISAYFLLNLQSQMEDYDLSWNYLRSYYDIIEKHNLSRLLFYFVNFYLRNNKVSKMEISCFKKNTEFFEFIKQIEQ
jgi:glycosyltransferase involved in cell wall biosynthesis